MIICTMCGEWYEMHQQEPDICEPCFMANFAAPPPAPGWLQRVIPVPYCDRHTAIRFGLALAAAWQRETRTDAGPPPPQQ